MIRKKPQELAQKLAVYIVTDEEQAGGEASLIYTVEKALEAGAGTIQLRHKTADTAHFLRLAKAIRELTRRFGALFIVNDRLDIALAAEADGIHVGQQDMPVELARRWLGEERVIGVSVGSPDEAREAERQGADYVGISPVFATGSKADAGFPVDLAGVGEITSATSLPAVGIGGINAANTAEVIKAGAVGVAVISAVMGQPDPYEATRALIAAVNSALGEKGVPLTGYNKGAAATAAVAAPAPSGTVGEFALIERLARLIGPPASPDLLIGIGDDTAVLAAGTNVPSSSAAAPATTTAGRHWLWTIDAQVEGVHFRRDLMGPEDIGYRAMAVNVSDIAAMGGRPRFALVSLMLPADIKASYIESVYRGLVEAAGAFGVTIAGGNITGHDRLILDVTVLGEAPLSGAICRHGARPGDKIMVTGRIGSSAAGLWWLLSGEKMSRQARPEQVRPEQTQPERRPLQGAAEIDIAPLVAAYRRPVPRLAEAAAAVATGAVTAMMDISDGLAGDLHHLCQAGGVGARLDLARIPVHDSARQAAEMAGIDIREWLLGGGEDFELLMAVKPEAVDRVQRAVAEAAGMPATVIGEFRPPSEGVMLADPEGRLSPLPASGWDHLKLPE